MGLRLRRSHCLKVHSSPLPVEDDEPTKGSSLQRQLLVPSPRSLECARQSLRPRPSPKAMESRSPKRCHRCCSSRCCLVEEEGVCDVAQLKSSRKVAREDQDKTRCNAEQWCIRAWICAYLLRGDVALTTAGDDLASATVQCCRHGREQQ